LFEWVVENLCKNAIDAMNSKGNIEITVRKEAYMCSIEVADTGKGIPPGRWDTIFMPGYTTKSRGWGLGLSLARRIVEEYHRGRIFVKSSDPATGTVFRIELRP
jgi:signal transduction histidine kinase